MKINTQPYELYQELY